MAVLEAVNWLKYPYVKCRKCKRRIVFPIKMRENQRLTYQSKKGALFRVRCPNCGLEETYRAKQVHFLDVVGE
jgi:ribosomal protein S27E